MLNKITKVSYKVYLIITFTTLATLLITGVALYSINAINSDFDEFNRLNDNAIKASDVQSHMLLARVRALTFRNTGNEKYFVESLNELAAAEAVLDDEIRTSRAQVTIDTLTRTKNNIIKYQNVLGDVKQLMHRRNEIVKANHTITDELQNDIRVFRTQVVHDDELFETVVEAEYQFTVSLQYSSDFLIDNAEDDFELYQASFALLQQKLVEFNKQYPTYRAPKFGQQLKDFNSNINEMFSIITKRNEMWNVSLANLGDEITNDLQAIKSRAFDIQNTLANQIARLSGNSIFAVITTLLISAPIVLFICHLVTRSLVVPINTTKAIIDRMASGDLQKSHSDGTANQGADEVAQMRSSLEQMEEKFYSIVEEVTQNCELLASASEQLTTINNEVLQSSMTQQQETDQVATAMNEMSAAINEVAIGANTASQEAESATEEANTGMAVMTTSMEQISSLAVQMGDLSKEISTLRTGTEEVGDVMNVIQNIAEQTNLLALNAAIEAARAGDQGRGFAVVADEVRQLAQQTQKAVEKIEGQITTLQSDTSKVVDSINASQTMLENTVTQAESASVAFSTITQSVAQTNSLNTQIATATEEQSSTAEMISESITVVRDKVDQTVNMVADSNQASEELARMSITLAELMRFFKLKV